MRKGDTILFEAPPSAVAYAAVGGKKEAEGPLADAFDMLIADTLCGEKTWEKAESDFARYCLEAALKKGRLQADALDAVFAGDLQCQCTASAYTMRGFDTPYLGLYGACSTMAEGFGLAACHHARGHEQQPFLRGGAPVPHAAGLWRQTYAHGPVDGNRRRCRHPGSGRRSALCARRHIRPRAGL